MADFFPATFHFIRPMWLYALIPAVFFYGLFLLMDRHGTQWSRAVNRNLLPYLLDGGKSSGRSVLLSILFLGWILSILAMAGPAWNKLPQPVHEKQDALVIVQDLSLSFFAQDLSPDRITRARRKLVDLLKNRKEGMTALIAYSADAHTIVPLTDDIRTIENMVPALSPAIMPGYGSNVVAAVGRAVELLKNGAGGTGRILLITDEVSREDVDDVGDILRGRSVTLSVIGVGTENGGPVPQKNGGFWKDQNGSIIVPKMDRTLLRRLADENGGRYSDITLTDRDIDYLLAEETLFVTEDKLQQVEREFDTWQDMGSRLVVLVLPLALMAFRRGLIIGLLCILVIPANDCYAMTWQDLWLTRDQQAAKSMQSGDFKGAAETFKTRQWKGAAEFRAGAYSNAVETYTGMKDADGYYNLGNSLAKSGKLEESIEAYTKALEYEPEMEDAIYNRDLVRNLLREQQKQQQEDRNRDEKGRDGDQQQGQEGNQDRNQQDEKSGKQGEDGLQKQRNSAQEDNQSQSRSEESKDGQSATAEQLDQNTADQEQAGKKDENNSEEEDSKSAALPEPTEREIENSEDPEGAVVDNQQLIGEEQQAMEQLLRKIPDDPGGFLRRKFEYEFQQGKGRGKSNNNNKIW